MTTTLGRDAATDDTAVNPNPTTKLAPWLRMREDGYAPVLFATKKAAGAAGHKSAHLARLEGAMGFLLWAVADAQMRVLTRSGAYHSNRVDDRPPCLCSAMRDGDWSRDGETLHTARRCVNRRILELEGNPLEESRP